MTSRVKEFIEGSAEQLDNLTALLEDAERYLLPEEQNELIDILNVAGIETTEDVTKVQYNFIVSELKDLDREISFNQYFRYGFPTFGRHAADLRSLLIDIIEDQPSLKHVIKDGVDYIDLVD